MEDRAGAGGLGATGHRRLEQDGVGEAKRSSQSQHQDDLYKQTSPD